MTFDPIAPSDAPPQQAARRRPALARLLRRFGLARPRADLDTLARRILLPSLPITDEDHARTRLRDTGQHLARQEDWPRLAEHAGSYPIALVIAHTHMDIGRAWRSCTAQGIAAQDREARFLDHFRRAEDLLAPYDPETCDAPSLAAAHCALLPARPAPRRRVVEDHARLIALDPQSAWPLRALGAALLPARFGSFDAIDREARRLAARPVTGAAAYAWVWLDALAFDPAGLGTVDPGLFVDGLHAIAARHPDQHIINELAAFCGLTMAPRGAADRMPARRERARATLHACLDPLVTRHLHELHPLVWARALCGPDAALALPPRRVLMTRGRQAALRAIAARFADDLAEGCALGFSRAGMYRLPAL